MKSRATSRTGVRSALSTLLLALSFVAAFAQDDATRQDALKTRLAQGAMSKFRFAAAPAPAPDVTFVRRDGAPVPLSALSGRVVLVNVWASWCPPCREEMPSLAQLASRLQRNGLEVIALSIDRQPADAERFLAALGIGDLPLFMDPESSVAKKLAVGGVPVSIVFDVDGREVGRLQGGANWTSDNAILLLRAVIGGRLVGTGSN